MTTRIFQQHARGYGAAPTNITVTLDGQEIFSGPILTENSPLPVLPDPDINITNEIFTWEKDSTFSGTMELAITVSGSPLLLADTLANYPTNSPEYADQFVGFYSYVDGGTEYSDPFTNEQIDGIPVSRIADPALSGQWWWKIMPGSVFTATININASVQPYVVFDSVPGSISAGSIGEFSVSMPSVSPEFPLPRTLVWQVQNGTTVDSDFVALSGNVEFVTANSAFSISTAGGATPGNFSVQIRNQSGNLISTSEKVNIV